MNRTYFFVIIAIALASVFLIAFSMWHERPVRLTEAQLPLISHPKSPFKSYISGVGIVEASSDNISIGTPLNRIVEKVLVKVGNEVKKGDVLFVLENQDLEADLHTKQVAYDIAVARLNKLEAMPRPEDITAAQSSFKTAEVDLSQAKSQYEMVQGLEDSRAISREEINRRRFNYEQAESKLQQAQADLEKVKSGTWKPDLQIAYLETLQAKADVARSKTEIDRTIIRSPIDGKILQVKIHEGEFPPLDSFRMPLMILGDTEQKHLSVSINQFDAPNFNSNAPAVAYLQGNARFEFPLEFVRIEPYLINKQNLNNNIQEKVDTRVLEVIYRFKTDAHNLFIGQQMDVFIQADFSSETLSDSSEEQYE